MVFGLVRVNAYACPHALVRPSKLHRKLAICQRCTDGKHARHTCTARGLKHRFGAALGLIGKPFVVHGRQVGSYFVHVAVRVEKLKRHYVLLLCYGCFKFGEKCAFSGMHYAAGKECLDFASSGGQKRLEQLCYFQ